MQQVISPPAEVFDSARFFHAIAALQPRVAVFDCDGTLWPGDAGVGFMRWSMSCGLLSRDASNWLDDRYRAYLRGEVSELAICGEMVQIYRGLREQELRHAARDFFDHTVRPQIFPEMFSLCEQLRREGVELWAVSSTNQWMIEHAAAEFGIPAERVLAARVRLDHGVATDVLTDVPTDEGKAHSLRRVGISHPDAVFGNSIHDAAMLLMARQAFPVNPTPALLEFSASHGWPVFHPQPAKH